MMIVFHTKELETDLGRAFETLKKWIRFDFFNFGSSDYDPTEVDLHVDENTPVPFIFKNGVDYNEVPVRELLYWSNNIVSAKLLNGNWCTTSTESIWLVIPASDRAESLVHSGIAPECEINHEYEYQQKKYFVELTSEPNILCLAMERDGKVSEDFSPSWYPEARYVRIRHPQGCEPQILMSLLSAFLFELSSSHGLDFSVVSADQPWSGFEDLDLPLETTKDAGSSRLPLRGLLVGKSINDAYQLFLAGVRAIDKEHAILNYTRTIEHVSTTVVRKSLHDSLRARLAGPKAFTPDADFLDSIAGIVENHRMYKKDSESIKLTIETCCDAIELSALSPRFLKYLPSVNSQSDPKSASAALAELGEAVAATRNSIAHAKSNYSPNGKECPQDQMEDFSRCVRLVAIQAIRWLGAQSESQRVG